MYTCSSLISSDSTPCLLQCHWLLVCSSSSSYLFIGVSHKAAFHDLDIDTDTDILPRILAGSSPTHPTCDFLAMMSVSVSVSMFVSWNAAYTQQPSSSSCAAWCILSSTGHVSESDEHYHVWLLYDSRQWVYHCKLLPSASTTTVYYYSSRKPVFIRYNTLAKRLSRSKYFSFCSTCPRLYITVAVSGEMWT